MYETPNDIYIGLAYPVIHIFSQFYVVMFELYFCSVLNFHHYYLTVSCKCNILKVMFERIFFEFYRRLSRPKPNCRRQFYFFSVSIDIVTKAVWLKRQVALIGKGYFDQTWMQISGAKWYSTVLERITGILFWEPNHM